MARMIFVNLPVSDLARATAFWGVNWMDLEAAAKAPPAPAAA